MRANALSFLSVQSDIWRGYVTHKTLVAHKTRSESVKQRCVPLGRETACCSTRLSEERGNLLQKSSSLHVVCTLVIGTELKFTTSSLKGDYTHATKAQNKTGHSGAVVACWT